MHLGNWHLCSARALTLQFQPTWDKETPAGKDMGVDTGPPGGGRRLGGSPCGALLCPGIIWPGRGNWLTLGGGGICTPGGICPGGRIIMGGGIIDICCDVGMAAQNQSKWFISTLCSSTTHAHCHSNCNKQQVTQTTRSVFSIFMWSTSLPPPASVKHVFSKLAIQTYRSKLSNVNMIIHLVPVALALMHPFVTYIDSDSQNWASDWQVERCDYLLMSWFFLLHPPLGVLSQCL